MLDYEMPLCFFYRRFMMRSSPFSPFITSLQDITIVLRLLCRFFFFMPCLRRADNDARAKMIIFTRFADTLSIIFIILRIITHYVSRYITPRGCRHESLRFRAICYQNLLILARLRRCLIWVFCRVCRFSACHDYAATAWCRHFAF